MKDIGEQFVLITGISWMPGMLLPRAHKNFYDYGLLLCITVCGKFQGMKILRKDERSKFHDLISQKREQCFYK